jgi:hypothetical protein
MKLLVHTCRALQIRANYRKLAAAIVRLLSTPPFAENQKAEPQGQRFPPAPVLVLLCLV